ncbi:hypothetical protein WOLCODRAFT_136318 [Wolfiporia cocos MD-104 SS10]|uniref:Uncharacterized protein n=1 Tax=Wolfiporia cocos (strain MD-104) TaxID=742152 RepID=A0A2H3JR79_WOLCO|nr:hypothetical protein WOLCODRAFT_136318 [Wolfiporia cocos MD-104 SS10]
MSRTTQRRPPPPPPVRTAIACEEDPFADGPLVLVTQYARPPRSAHPAPPAPAKLAPAKLAPAPVIASRTRIAAPSEPPSAREETKQAQSTAGAGRGVAAVRVPRCAWAPRRERAPQPAVWPPDAQTAVRARREQGVRQERVVARRRRGGVGSSGDRRHSAPGPGTRPTHSFESHPYRASCTLISSRSPLLYISRTLDKHVQHTSHPHRSGRSLYIVHMYLIFREPSGLYSCSVNPTPSRLLCAIHGAWF